MANIIAISILEYKIEKLIDKRNRAIALGKNDAVWKLNMKIDNARNRIMIWSY